jgi:hypothetical protein
MTAIKDNTAGGFITFLGDAEWEPDPLVRRYSRLAYGPQVLDIRGTKEEHS